MAEPKKKKKKIEKDTDYTDEQGGGANDELTEGEFMKTLKKVIHSDKKSLDEEMSKTSE